MVKDSSGSIIDQSGSDRAVPGQAFAPALGLEFKIEPENSDFSKEGMTSCCFGTTGSMRRGWDRCNRIGQSRVWPL